MSYVQTEDEQNILLQMAQKHVQMSPYILFGLLVNIKRCIIHGMWYSIRLWNQIKSNYILFKLTEVDKILKFSPSITRIELLTDIMLCHFYKEDGSVYESFVVYKSTDDERNVRINSLHGENQLRKGLRHGEKAGHHYAYGTMSTGKKIDTQSEFDFIKQLAEKYETREKARAVITNNTITVCRYLCNNLNLYLYHRVAFNSKRRLNDPSGRGEDGARLTKGQRDAAKKGDLGTASAESPEKNNDEPSVPASASSWTQSQDQDSDEDEDKQVMKVTRELYWKKYIQNPEEQYNTPTNTTSPPRKKIKGNNKGGRRKTKRKKRRKRKKKTKRKKRIKRKKKTKKKR